MKPKFAFMLLLHAFCLAIPTLAYSDAPSFNVTSTTPVGSWVEREQRTVDHRNRETVSIIRQTMVESEQRDGELHYWIETESTNYKVKKKGVRKQQGDTAIVKVLVPASTLDGDPANLVNNLSGFGKEIIFQNGSQQPMRMREGGTMADLMLKALGVKVDYTFESLGRESVNIPAGEFRAEKFAGSGSVETRMLLKKITVESQSEVWLTPDIPFGFARMVSNDLVNGKSQTSQAEVTQFGTSGGVSKIVGEPVDFMGEQTMPGINLKDLMPGG
ncbi:MAG: hypothetical protein KJO35_11055 [Gammaproteobacteria bacterium]|nr:hypothetical protein [Gammaproteobacteria bacterium]NNF67047.1 hypothetical protein [Gammaproteobacteria bacterium]